MLGKCLSTCKLPLAIYNDICNRDSTHIQSDFISAFNPQIVCRQQAIDVDNTQFSQITFSIPLELTSTNKGS